uniref:Reverse transcriptase/retrotransposon-derived protein RNase H-like domain-containing protein n=1 Tax=Solanum lycopersicum TaxID=4081 RepID=A0A3Q7I4Q3_SOLLC
MGGTHEGDRATIIPWTCELLSQNKSRVWSEECQREFKGLKAAVMEEPVLTLLDFSKTSKIHTYV